MTRTFFNEPLSQSVYGVYAPVAGDWNGDGKHDIYWYSPGADNDTMWLSTTMGDLASNSTYDAAGWYTPVGGAFDDDGRDDIFLYGYGVSADTVWHCTSAAPGRSNHPQVVDGTYVVT